MGDLPRTLLRSLFDAAVRARRSKLCVRRTCRHGRRAGWSSSVPASAAAAMAAAVEITTAARSTSSTARWSHGHLHPDETDSGPAKPGPVPDAAGMAGAKRLLALVGGLSASDHVLLPDLGRRIGAHHVSGAPDYAGGHAG
jgi:hydroxypyruvate reductase